MHAVSEGRGVDATRLRKLDHIRVTVDSRVEHRGTTLLEDAALVHNSLPELGFDEVSLRTRLLGKEVEAPLMVTGMTGGHPVTGEINCAIAEAVRELGLAMGVGSQRAAIEDEKLADTFRAARRCGGDIPLVANIGAPQLVKGYGLAEAERAVEMIEADALAVHLNPAQEVFQPEGDTDYRGVVEKIVELADKLSVPVIVKETGHGLSYELVLSLHGAGIDYFDVSGSGGTSWILVEKYRRIAKGEELYAAAADTYSYWGVPTALSIIESRWAAPSACIIASGGIRSGLDAAKAIALGADIAGMALPVIRAYAAGRKQGVKQLLEKTVFELRVALFLTGCKDIDCLKTTKRLVVTGRLHGLVEARGIPLDYYLEARRAPRVC